MGKTDHLSAIRKIHEAHFGTAEEQELVKRLAAERARANAEMAEKLANLHMPSDILERARAWRMEAWATVLWNNAFQAGYREAMRDRAARPTTGDSDDHT